MARYDLKFKPVSVELLGKMDYIKKAWEISRPHLNPDEVDFKAVIEQDLPVNGFAYYYFKMSGSILFRDLLYTVRPINSWSCSNRTAKLSPENVFISGEYDNPLHYSEFDRLAVEQVFIDLENGVAQDKAKLNFPLSFSYTFLLGIDYRTLMSFLKTLRETNPFLFKEYGLLMMLAAGIEMWQLELNSVKSFYEEYALTDDEFHSVGKNFQILDMFSGVEEVIFGLHSQFIRKNYSSIKSSLWNLISDFKDNIINVNLQSTSRVTVAYYFKGRQFRKLLSVRSCFFSDMNENMWGQIIGSVAKDMDTDTFIEQLPCHGDHDKCVYFEDIYSRVKLKEVNHPCPILIEDTSMIDKRIIKQGENRILNKYKECVVDRLINDNPNNKYRREYEDNIKKLGGTPE